MGLHHHLLAIIVCYQKPLLDEWLIIFQLIFDWKFTMYINSNSKTNVNHMNYARRTRSHWSFRFGETIFFLENSWLASKLFQHWTFLLMINDWKQSEKNRCWFMLRLQFLTTPGVEAGLLLSYMKKTAIDFPLGGNCTSSWGMETRFTNNKTPGVGC